MAITAEHLAQLFESDLPDPHLVVVCGAAQVVPGPADDADGLVIASRADLLTQYGGRPRTRDAFEQLAQRLDSTVAGIGG